MANQMWKPSVSIVMPVYNGENYLREAIDSALAQTYDNLEVIVVNDGSTDGTDEIAKSYGDKIRYYAKENGGVSTALNMGIENMRGEYFSWLSHDDLYTADKIEKNIAALSVAQDKRRIVYSSFAQIDENGNHFGMVNAKTKHLDADCEYWLFPLVTGLIHGCTLLIHCSHFEKHGVFDERLACTQDYALWHKMFRKQELIYIDDPLVLYRVHSTQGGSTSDRAVPEGENLWMNILSSLTKREICKFSGTQQHFWSTQAQFMTAMSYKMAADYCYKRLDKSVGTFRRIYEKTIKPLYCGIVRVIRPNAPFRLYSAIKRHGITETFRILMKRIRRQS